MIFRFGHIFAGGFLVLWLAIAPPAFAGEKFIHLRNERIRTVAPTEARGGPTPPGAPANPVQTAQTGPGLWLVQFTSHPESSWREVLAAEGCDLLWYVPEDAFVARCLPNSIERVKALPFIQWTTPYRPSHKLHPAFNGPGGGAGAPPGGVAGQEIAVLLARGASPPEIAQVRALLAIVRQEAHPRFGTILRGKVAPGQLSRLAQSAAVLWVEPSAPVRMFDEIASKIVGGPGDSHATATQELGLDGRNVTVAIADSGLDSGDTNDMHPDLQGRVQRLIAYGSLTSAMDTHGHGTHIAGIIAGDGTQGLRSQQEVLFGLGVAPRALLVAQRIFDGAGAFQPTDSSDLTRDAVAAGAEIGSNSWGVDTQGNYDLRAMEFDELTRDADPASPGDQPYLLVFSAGNAGPAPQTVGSPAVAKNVIAVGASQNARVNFASFTQGQDAMADFSSRGPTQDGRVKPDLVAPGTWVASLRSRVADEHNAWLGIDSDHMYMGGTSQAAPHVAGAAAVAIQFLKQSNGIAAPSPALVKAALVHSAVALGDEALGAVPNMTEGWGRLDLTELTGTGMDHRRSHQFINQTVLLTNGQVFEQGLIIAASNEPLRLTLAYTDFPGFVGALPTLVNDLDLELVAPDGHVYRGNQFDQGESAPDAASTDTLNNVESIFLRMPVPGEYRVRVRATKVVEDSCANTAAVDQDFGLVICGSLPTPGSSLVLLDRSRYTAPGKINIKVFDLDAAGFHTVTARVSSATEPAGKLVVLTNAGEPSLFSGFITTIRGTSPASGNQLRIADEDWIGVEYVDDGLTATATATGDLLPPTITDVDSTDEFGQRAVVWQTFEEATSLVLYGTNPVSLDQAVSNRFLTTAHMIELPGIVPGLTYYYAVLSTDTAGNSASNGGFSFASEVRQTVLLVDDYSYNGIDTPIPINIYTDPLDQLGLTYKRWDPVEHGGELPTYKNLSPYRIVVWRVNDSIHYPLNSIPPAQEVAIEQYLANGGGFMMASMEILTRLLDQGSFHFVTNVLHVKRFVRNPDGLCTDCDENFQIPSADGIAGDLIGDGLQLSLAYDNYPTADPLAGGPDFGDTFGAASDASTFLVESSSGRTCGVRSPRTGQDSAGRAVFISFPLDAIADPGSRQTLLQRAFQFLVPGLNGIGAIVLNRDQYRIPDLVSIEVADSDLAGQQTVNIEVQSTSNPNPVRVVLHETARLGVFRGSVQVAAAAVAGSGQVAGSDGDILTASYLDQSAGQPVRATALIDTVEPLIFGLDVSAAYSDATIIWDTDEPADSLVQFGESVFLGRTAYSGELDTHHSVTLSGLTPDRSYYYKIASRDAAGNVTVDDRLANHFDTLGPLDPPFIDDMEDETNIWRVVDGLGTEATWALGTPNNDLVVGGHGPPPDNRSPTAWTTALSRSQAIHIDSSLISPAITLAGGNVAHLHFWHAYRFSPPGPSTSETGRLMIVTNQASPPLLLREYHGLGSPWQKEDVDLTPFIGNPVFIIWNHLLQSSVSNVNFGWNLDDVCVIVTNLAPGIIEITNTLASAKATLTGPASRTAQGYFSRFTNLPPGRYTVTWTNSAYYDSPPTQTNTLAPGGFLKLSGVYTFADVNNNGMSDRWETSFFGTVSTNRTRSTDTDGDGATDYEEFIAGTDPNRVESKLRVVAFSTGNLQLQWPTVPGRVYLVEMSSDLRTWIRVGDWTQATGSTMTRSLALLAPGGWFRVSVRP